MDVHSKQATPAHSARVSVIIPCYNEEAAISQTVRGFREALPNATIYVYDNNSSDRTVEVARAAGAVVRREQRQGKGYVVRRMFADVDADVFVLVDGDATYDPKSAPKMIQMMLEDGVDMVTGNRASTETAAYRRGHRLGNRMMTGLVANVFGREIGDMLSGYRVLSRRFVKSFPAMAKGFETETELTVHALEIRMPIAEVSTPYFARPEGSVSKLSTYRDGIRILRMVGLLVKDERPMQFFTAIAAMLAIVGLLFGGSVFVEFLETGLVPRLPTAVLAASVMLLSFLSFSSGIVLESVALSRREARRFAYLAHRAPDALSRSAPADAMQMPAAGSPQEPAFKKFVP